MIIDAVVFIVPLLLGLIVMWRGIGRTLLSIPVRLIAAVALAWIVSSLTILFLVVYQQPLVDAAAQRLALSSPIVLSPIWWLVFIIVMVALLLILRRIRARVLKEGSQHSAGAIDGASGFVFGAAAGLLVVLVFAFPAFMFSQVFLPDPSQAPDGLHGSISLPLIKRISDAMRPLLVSSLPDSLTTPPSDLSTAPKP